MMYCVFLSNNVYINLMIIILSFLVSLFAFGHVLENMNEKEIKYIQKLVDFLS